MIDATRALVPFLVACLALGLVGCAASDHPEVAGDSASELLAEEAAGTAHEAASVDESVTPSSVCTPREARWCRWYLKDSSGRLECPWSFQLCRLDGGGWTPCGLYVVDPSGNIVPR
jgi:hypothetical protein